MSQKTNKTTITIESQLIGSNLEGIQLVNIDDVEIIDVTTEEDSE